MPSIREHVHNYCAYTLTLANDVWIRARNFAGTDYINMFKVNEDDEIETGAKLITGSIEAVEDAGAVTVFDMPVSVNPAVGAEMSATLKIDGDNILTIGAEADSAGGIQNPKVVAHCGLNLKEITTPIAKADYGAVYTKTDNNLYFQNGAGVENEISLIGNHYAEMYLNDNSNATVIETANTPIALRQFTVGSLDGWTFNVGSTGVIASYQLGTGGAGYTRINDVAHGLANGDIITVRGSTVAGYNGIHTISSVSADYFDIDETFSVDGGASDWDEGSHLIASVGSAGEYAMSWDISASESGGAGSHVKIVVYVNTTADPKGIARRKCANNDQRCASGQSLLTIADGDKVYTTIESTGTNDITAQYGNITLRRR